MWAGNDVWIEHIAQRRISKNTGSDYSKVWWLIFLLLNGILLMRSAVVQLGRGESLAAQANSQRIRTLVLPAPRGLIYDRNGVELATNVPIPHEVVFDDSKGLMIQPYDRTAVVNINSLDDKKVIMEVIDRNYPLGKFTSQIIGYTGAISANELEKNSSRCVGKSDSEETMVGRSGIEAFYDCRLAGVSGELTVEVNTAGRMVRVLGKRESAAGESLNLTIDSEMQRQITEAMSGYKGAVVVSSPLNGEIYGLGSFPTYDPSWFGLRGRSEDLEKYSAKIGALFNDPDRPLMNRAIAGAFPPGSIFKLISSLAGLETASVSKNDYYTDTGVVKLGTYEFRNWYFLKYGTGEGKINVVRAIARSTDTFYYDLGGKMGPEPMAFWARKAGMGKKNGIDLTGEVDGLIPDPEWKLNVKKEKWYLGNTYHMAIGQGDVLATPLQLATMTGIFVNDGKLCVPYLLKGKEYKCTALEMSKSNLEVVVDGMIGACSPGGTAGVFYNQPYQVACKTGTAEYGPRKQNGSRDTHAWFTMAGPMIEKNGVWILDNTNNKAITITVFVEGGGEGSTVAAPVAKKLMDWWMDIEKKD